MPRKKDFLHLRYCNGNLFKPSIKENICHDEKVTYNHGVGLCWVFSFKLEHLNTFQMFRIFTKRQLNAPQMVVVLKSFLAIFPIHFDNMSS